MRSELGLDASPPDLVAAGHAELDVHDASLVRALAVFLAVPMITAGSSFITSEDNVAVEDRPTLPGEDSMAGQATPSAPSCEDTMAARATTTESGEDTMTGRATPALPGERMERAAVVCARRRARRARHRHVRRTRRRRENSTCSCTGQPVANRSGGSCNTPQFDPSPSTYRT